MFKHFKFKNLSIQKKFLYTVLPFSIICIILFAFVFYKVSQNLTLDRVCENKLNTLKLTADRIDTIRSNIISVSNIYFFNADIRQFYKNTTFTNQFEEINELYKVADFVENVSHNFVNIKFNTTLLGFNSKYYSDSNVRDLQEDISRSKDWLKHFEDKNKLLWTDTYTYHDKNILTAIKYIVDYYTGDNLGILIFDLDEDQIFQYYSSILNESTDIIVLNKYGKVLSGKDKSSLAKTFSSYDFFDKMDNQDAGYFVTNHNGEKVVVSFHSIRDMNWYIVDITSLDSLLKDFDKIRNIILLFTFTIIVIIFIFSVIISYQISSPLKVLSFAMYEFERGNIDVSVNLKQDDEIGYLTKSFNKMIVKIKNLLNEVIQEQEIKRKLEIQILQAQINPHFLYNTLNSIRCMARENKVHTIDSLIISLVSILKQTISSNDEFYTLEQEFNCLKAYITILEVRYDNFKVTWDIDENVLKYKTFKFILQPILENSVFHGLCRKSSNGLISIRAGFKDDSILIEITDNGVGMTPEQLNLIWNKKAETIGSNGIALFNIQRRIKLTFGEKYGISITSQKDIGTSTSVLLPAVDMKEKYLENNILGGK